MEAAKLRQDLTQCWLAETLVQVLERARAATQQKCHLALVSLGDTVVAEQGAVLSELVNGFLRNEALAAFSVASSVCYAHVNDLDELQLWASNGCINRATGALFVIFAPCADDVAAHIMKTASKLDVASRRVVLVLHNPMGLLGLEVSSRATGSSSAYYRIEHVATESLGETESDWRRKMKFIAQPLDCLRDQCGWHFVMEIVRWVPESTGAMESRFGLGRATMFSTINQLPFQLLLLILRWSHFHPEIVRVCAKKLRRQTQLIPQARVRQELAELQARESKVWSGLYPPVDQEEVNSVAYSSLLFPTQSQMQSPKLDRLSKCHLWDTQKQFYKDQGIRAWSSGAIPFGVSSSSFLAAGYARVAVDFLLNNASHVRPSFKENGSPNCFVWEAASGSCKFLHSFMLHFTGLVEADDEFKRRGLVPLVVATDLSEQVLSSRRQMTCFRPFIERGQLDFAFFDTQEFIHGCSSGSKKRKTLELIHAGRQWNVGSDGPVSLIGNYFFDSLRADVFSVAIQRDNLVRDGSSPSGPNSGEHVVVQVALLDKDTSSIANMDICLQPVEDPSTRAIYEDGRLNATLVQVLNKFRSRVNGSSSEPVASTGLVLFPVEAFEFLLTLVDRDDEAELFPFAILAGDASFSFRDAISSAFITTKIAQDGSIEHVSLELPQLSPHPDCFCLPVDFEIFKLFIEHLSNSGAAAFARSELVSAPASDTFDVFFAMIEPRSRRTANAQANATPTVTASLLQSSFKHQFSRFTPGDCDLLWGMMSFDDGARCFSTDTLLALLAQTGWDFDLFAVLKWGLLNRLRQQENNSETEHYQQLLIEAGVKSWRTFYHMEQQSETDTTMRGVRLQLARWFYDLEAFDCVLEVLMPWRDEAHKDFGSDDVGVFYLLGLTSLRMEECWTALSFFRLCARLAPTKLKYQRQVARTLLALQTLRSASNSSNESDGVRSS